VTTALGPTSIRKTADIEFAGPDPTTSSAIAEAELDEGR
jgi:hypothetical protein